MLSPRMAMALSALALVGCAGADPPEELAGLWSPGPAACAAGVGVRFEADAIEAVYAEQVETLFARPRYEVEANDDDSFVVRIDYDLPRIAGAARSPNQYGMLLLERQADGGIAPHAHALVDPRTGAMRTRIVDDPVARLLTLQPCGPHPWSGGLRGRA